MSAPRGSRYDFGDGDRCPLDPEHGRMYVLTTGGKRTQWCASQTHDGAPKTAPGGGLAPARSFWPYDDMALAAAVKGA